jgi:hypothetical protein
MVDRRALIKFGMIGLPLTGCSTARTAPDEDLITSTLTHTNKNLPAAVVDDARKAFEAMQESRRTVMDYNVSYDVAPRFFPSMT